MTRFRARMADGGSSDVGAAAIVLAVLVVAVFIPVTAVAVDLSSAFANRRQMQNAADAAAMAGARVLVDARRGTATGGDIEQAAADVAGQNGQLAGDPVYNCEVVETSDSDPSTWPATACTSWTSGSSYNAVRVSTHNVVATFFAGAMGAGLGGTGVDTTEAAAQATAAIQAVGAIAAGPFGLCTGTAVVNVDPRQQGPQNPAVIAWSGSEWELNQAAVDLQYYVYRGAGNPQGFEYCGLNSADWAGLICPQEQLPSVKFPPSNTSTNPCNGTLEIPTADAGADPCTAPCGSWVWATTGSKVGPTVSKIAGYPGCFPDGLDLSGPINFSPCATVLPLCDQSNGETGNNATLHCVKFGAFLIYPQETSCEAIWAVAPSAFPTCDPSWQTKNSQNPGIWGVFLGAAQLVDGVPTSGTPDENDLYTINMVQ
jgi:Flp pilus assembly protein TadG